MGRVNYAKTARAPRASLPSVSHDRRQPIDEAEAQRLPLFLRQRDGRVRLQPAVTERELRAYVQWVSETTRLDPIDIAEWVIDQALRDYLKRDTPWRRVRARVLRDMDTRMWRDVFRSLPGRKD
jgi:hypothetical protein